MRPDGYLIINVNAVAQKYWEWEKALVLANRQSSREDEMYFLVFIPGREDACRRSSQSSSLGSSL